MGILISSLGRQGAPGIAEDLTKLIEEKGKETVSFVMAEFTLDKLKDLAGSVDAFVQVGPLFSSSTCFPSKG